MTPPKPVITYFTFERTTLRGVRYPCELSPPTITQGTEELPVVLQATHLLEEADGRNTLVCVWVAAYFNPHL